MSTVVMVDAAQDLRPLIPQLRAQGLNPAVACVYTTAGGSADAFVATPQYVADLHGLGLSVLPVCNGPRIDGGAPGTAAQAMADMQAAEAQLAALGVPAGVYPALDIERRADAGLQGAYLATVARMGRASIYGGAWIVYGALYDAAFGASFDSALQEDPGDVSRLLFWLASYITPSLPALPSWDAPYGPTGLPWQAQHQQQVQAWQFATCGAYDLSLLRLPVPSYGTEGLWLPGGGVGQPVAPKVPVVDVAGALAGVQRAEAALAVVRGALGA